jgi:hypothetical protein
MAISGKSGYLTYGAVGLCIERWSVTSQAPAIDTTNSCTAGFQDNVAGPFSGQITASGPILLAGTILPSVGAIVLVELGYLVGLPSPAAIPIAAFRAIVSSIRSSLDVSGRYEYELTMQSVHLP